MTAPARRMPVPYDVIRVGATLMTVIDVSDDGTELDATWTTGGRCEHFQSSAVVLVSPPRGN